MLQVSCAYDYASFMAELEKSQVQHEARASFTSVQQLLQYMLVIPYADHRQAVRNILSVNMCCAHVMGLLTVADVLDKKLKMQAWKACTVRRKDVAFHVWLYHFSGGADGVLDPPPTLAANPRSAQLRDAAKADATKLQKKLDALRHKLTGNDDDPAASEQQSLRGVDAVIPSAPTGKLAYVSKQRKLATAAAPSPNPSPASPSEAELARRRNCCFALACGTHDRLGLQSFVRQLAGQEHVLQSIAEFADINTNVRLQSPPPLERRQLHDHLRLKLAEIGCLNEAIDARNVTIRKLEQLERQAWRNVESLRKQLDETMAGADRRREEDTARVEEVRRLGIDFIDAIYRAKWQRQLRVGSRSWRRLMQLV